MFEQPRRRMCLCGQPLLLVRSGRCRHMVLDGEPHPTGDVRMIPRPVGWLAKRLVGNELARYKGKRYIDHHLTCQGDPPTFL